MDASVSESLAIVLNGYVPCHLWTCANLMYWVLLACGALIQKRFGLVLWSQVGPVVIKYMFRRKRPERDGGDRVFWDRFSFPSGHAYVLFWVAGSNNPWLCVPAGIGSLDRVRKGAHYLGDVVAGALLGLVTSYFLPWPLAIKSF